MLDLNVEINTRATRSVDATLSIGGITITFARGQIKMTSESAYLREDNPQEFDTMERIIHNFIGEPITTDVLKALSIDLAPIVRRLKRI